MTASNVLGYHLAPEPDGEVISKFNISMFHCVWTWIPKRLRTHKRETVTWTEKRL